ncbi:inositol monophosphatase family protein [Prolixibacter denitrificans]|uniref:Inositol-1-monophosphatase n=1 Tax=Prolixibacter denitrificans TaxID=1541063 RepID=A0A2P8C943_9BACT|nr:inositol monophosphatase family protein [Prolixibacter denitrificans]PSK81469.1 myo-inositol-1(or 4)-monophosphatase [Prolixibacter denitrificans]GET21061.1 inositol monophosphatase [Prolixibacter denitrificans]
MNLEKLCTEVIRIVKETGQFIAGERKTFQLDAVERKGKSDFVSYVDKSAEKQLVEKLHQLLPEAGFITEENTAGNDGEEFKWIIDPLDGTTNFIHGIPPFAVSVALLQGNELVVGVVYEITQDECFYAWKDSAAYLNGNVIRVSDAATTQDSLIATGFPYYNFDRLDGYIDAMSHFMQHSHGLRRLGSAATDLAYVAAGRFEAFWEHALHAWDVAAGVLIIKQAGGQVTDFNGGDNFLFGGEIVAANDAYFKEFYDIVHQHLGN